VSSQVRVLRPGLSGICGAWVAAAVIGEAARRTLRWPAVPQIRGRRIDTRRRGFQHRSLEGAQAARVSVRPSSPPRRFSAPLAAPILHSDGHRGDRRAGNGVVLAGLAPAHLHPANFPTLGGVSRTSNPTPAVATGQSHRDSRPARGWPEAERHHRYRRRRPPQQPQSHLSADRRTCNDRKGPLRPESRNGQ
jgi:hypothetical protein